VLSRTRNDLIDMILAIFEVRFNGTFNKSILELSQSLSQDFNGPALLHSVEISKLINVIMIVPETKNKLNHFVITASKAKS
jgi:hypothetical protein